MKMMKSLMAASALMASFAAHAENFAITGGTVMTMGAKGTLENATVLVKDGKIELVSPESVTPAGYTVIDAAGKIVTPGLMVSDTNLGMGEVSLSGGVNDATTSKAKLSAGLDATWALNPDTTLIPVTRIEGVTRAVTGFARYTLFGGQGAVINLGGDDMVDKARAFVALNVADRAASANGGSRAQLWATITSKFDAAMKTDKKDDDKKAKPAKADADKDALKNVLSGDAALVVTVNRKADILNVIRLKSDYQIPRVVLKGAAEAWRVADKLAAADIAALVSGTDNLPGSFESLASTQANAGRLAAAGVTIAFIGDGSHNARLMPQHAGNAVANGLSKEAAMQAMTVNPAKIFGLSASYGSLEAGKDADVVVWDGDPIELMTSPDHVFIKGENIPLVSRQTKLRDRYQEISAHPALKK